VAMLVDDPHWLDQASQEVIAFSARRAGRVAGSDRGHRPGRTSRVRPAGGPADAGPRAPDDASARHLLDQHAADFPAADRERILGQALGNRLAGRRPRRPGGASRSTSPVDRNGPRWPSRTAPGTVRPGSGRPDDEGQHLDDRFQGLAVVRGRGAQDWLAGVPVMPDRGGQSEDALQDSYGDAGDGAAAVLFEVELAFEGLVD